MSKSILIITPRIPFPLKDGGALAMYQSIEMYHELGYEVHLLSINTHKHWLSEQDYPRLFLRLASFETVAVNTDIKVRSAFINLFSKQSYNVSRFINNDFEIALRNMLTKNEFDIIQFESIFVAPYLSIVNEHSSGKKICRIHNIEHLIWQRITSNEKSIFKRKYLRLLTDRLKNFELDILNQFDLILNISKKEEAELLKMGIHTPQYHVPYGIERPRFQRKKIAQEVLSVYHIGSMDWIPNQEGVLWFIKNAWPKVLEKQPQLKLYIAGKNMPNFIYKYASDNIEIVGEVDEMNTFSLEKNIMIIPLKSGAGMRIKLLESMILGKTIVSTKLGVESFDIKDGAHYLNAENDEEFVKQIDWCVEHIDAASKIGENAKEFAIEHYDKHKIYKALNEFLTEFISYNA